LLGVADLILTLKELAELGIGFFSTRPCQAQLLGYQLVDHPLRQKSWQSPVFKTLRNDSVACFRSLGRERDVHSFA
jgi:hypothetical protein